MSGEWIFLGIIAAVLFYGVALYNKLVGLRNGVKCVCVKSQLDAQGNCILVRHIEHLNQ